MCVCVCVCVCVYKLYRMSEQQKSISISYSVCKIHAHVKLANINIKGILDVPQEGVSVPCPEGGAWGFAHHSKANKKRLSF